MSLLFGHHRIMEAAEAALVMMVLEEGWLLLGQLRSRQLSEKCSSWRLLNEEAVVEGERSRAEHAKKNEMQPGAPRPSAAQDARLDEATRADAPCQTFSLHESTIQLRSPARPACSVHVQQDDNTPSLLPPIPTSTPSIVPIPTHSGHGTPRTSTYIGPSDLLFCCLFTHSLHQAQRSVTRLFS
jgi:hypothetical protein